jgi:cytochrome c oxidase subunit 2
MRASSAGSRHRVLFIALLAMLGLVLSACAIEAPQSALDPSGPFAQKPHDLYVKVFWVAVAVFVLVQGLILYVVVKFREKPDDDGSLPVQVHGNTKLEVFWTALPALILAAIAVPTIQMIFELRDNDVPAYEIEVIGHRWWWEYRYEGGTIATANELVIPVGEQVRLIMRSEESGGFENAVIHSYWIPALAGKRDVVPGRVSTINLQADEAGRFLGQCAEYCGLSHANMRNRAVAMPRAEFDAWLAAQREDAGDPTDSQAVLGKAEFLSRACASCHAIGGTEAVGITGPNLTHLMSRQEFAGAIHDLYLRDAEGNFTDEPNTDLLAKWVRCAPDYKAMRADTGVGMPCFTDSMTEQQASAIVAYLLTLK